MAKLTAARIREVIGPADEDLIIQILDIGAEDSDLLEAMAWLEEDDYVGPEREARPTGLAAQLCDLLERAKGPDEDRE